MLNDFFTKYAKLTDDELLELASDRHSLTDEAVTALDAELRQRNLTRSDEVEHQRFVRRMEHRESRTRRRKIFGKRQFSWRELLSMFGVMGLIFFAYFSLPSRYRLKADWQDAAACVTITSVIIVVGWRSLWRDMAFWTALILSSSIQLIVAHAWTQPARDLSRGAGKAAALLGFILFLAVYGCIRLVRRKFDHEARSESA